MRGKRLHLHVLAEPRRIIPAHAGQTSKAVSLGCLWADHPRACGANAMALKTVVRRSGSSPRMRGKPGPHRPARTRPGIIPAHAGQTRRTRPTSWPRSDHPRACGANRWDSNPTEKSRGSSPRMRGKPVNFRRRRLPSRIIPAHAGQTSGIQ